MPGEADVSDDEVNNSVNGGAAETRGGDARDQGEFTSEIYKVCWLKVMGQSCILRGLIFLGECLV